MLPPTGAWREQSCGALRIVGPAQATIKELTAES
jgi:hypothetical protein